MSKKLKPFDLQAALNGDPVMLRNGARAFVRHHETEPTTARNDSLLGYIGGCSSWSWGVDGASRYSEEDSPYDIVGMYPKIRTINGFEVPAPEKVAPKKHATCFHANVTHDYFYISYSWMGDIADFQALKRGLVFLNKEDAIANAKAMLGIDPND